MPETITLSAVGDIVAYHREPERAFEFTIDELLKGDVRFAQNERHYSDKEIKFGADMYELAPVSHVEALKGPKFDVLSFASNHSMDFGPETMLKSIEHLRGAGFTVIGAGANEAAARVPAIVESKGTKVGFLAYCSVLRPGHNADKDKPGAAPMRAFTHYHQVDWNPGTVPQIMSFPHSGDLDAIIADMEKLRPQVDVVAISLHWGIHFTPAMIADYQKEVAHKLIDAGADMILGHHPHELKAVEIYKGRPIFYSMGNFAFDQPAAVIKGAMSRSEVEYKKISSWNFAIDDDEWADYCFPPQARYSMIAKIEITGSEVGRVSFVPCLINGRAQPQVVYPDDPRFAEFITYMEEITASQDIKTRFRADGGDIVVEAGL